MPGVCAVLGSSERPGMTRTPSSFHLGAYSWSVLSFMSLPLSTSCPGAHRPKPTLADGYDLALPSLTSPVIQSLSTKPSIEDRSPIEITSIAGRGCERHPPAV